MDHDRTYLDDYRQSGYAVVKGVFRPDEVRELADAFDRVYRQGLTHRASFRHQNVLFRVAEDVERGRIVRMVQWPSYFEPVLARYRTDRRILAILAPLLGRDLKQIINQLHWKPPGAGGEFGYHQDIGFRRPRTAYRMAEISYVQTGIAIDPHRPENGAMTVLPGSHKLGELAFEKTGERNGRVMDRSLSDADLAALGLDPASTVDLCLDAGDVALWHLHTIHGSGPNLSHGERRFYLNGYVTAANCDRGEWAFRDGAPCPLGEPQLVHYEDLYARPEPHYVD
jgi:ectoine hydroxylase-related dioxygenase (phytanoyl-CoA dioxygenase family)